jgi:HNH endonuclease
MSSQQSKRNKNQQKQTSAFSDKQGEGMFQPRPFLMQLKKKKEEQSEQVDLETSLMRAERYGHNLSKINSTSIPSTQVVQPKLRVGNLSGSTFSKEVNRPKIQSANTVNNVKNSEVIQTARARTPRASKPAPTITQSGRISKPPQQLTAPQVAAGIKNKRKLKKGAAQKQIPKAKLKKLLEQLKKNPQQPYANLTNPANIGNQDFTAAQKKLIYAANMKKNGQLICDLTGQQLTRAKKSIKGVKPSPFEAQIDHIKPFSKGGTNSFGNAMVLSRYANRFKSAK